MQIDWMLLPNGHTPSLPEEIDLRLSNRNLLEPTFPIWVELGTDPSTKCRDYNTLRPPRVWRVDNSSHFLTCGPNFCVPIT